MRLTKLSVASYNRFHLNPNLRKFSLIPIHPVTILAGDNGSGKSSLCRLLMPWPAERTDLGLTGYISRSFEHKGHLYVDAVDKSGYSFTCDGVELNLSKGVRVQETLFQEHFQMDQPLLRLLSGEFRFTQMSPKQRHYWMSRLDGFQLERLENVIKRLKELRKEKEILLNYQQGQLGKYPIIDNLVALEQHRDDLYASIKELMQYPFKENVLPSDYLDQYKDRVTRLVRAKRDLRALPPSGTNLTSLKTKYSQLEAKRNLLLQSVAELDYSPRSLEGLPGLEECEQGIKALTEKLTNLPPEYNNPSLYPLWEAYSLEIHTCIKAIQEAPPSPPSVEELESASQSFKHYQSEISHLEYRLEELTESLQKPIVCPKCTHEFSQLGSASDLEHISLELNQRLQGLEVKQHQLECLNLDYLTSTTAELNYARLFDILNKHLPPLAKGLETITQNLWQGELESRACLLKQAVDNQRLQEQISKLQTYLDLYKAIDVQALTEKLAKYTQFNSQIDDIGEEMISIERSIKLEERRAKLSVNVADLTRLEAEYRALLPSFLENQINQGRMEAISVSLADHRGELNKVIHQLSTATANREHNEDISNSIVVLKEELATINAALNCLDGKKGFVGHLYKERLSSHISNLNHLLYKLWDTPIALSIPSEDMTFRFPLELDGIQRADAAEGSKGMQEVIDLAFVLLVRETLDLQHLPLVLDEFGSALDPVNLSKAFNFLNELQLSNLVIVSHVTEVLQHVDESHADFVVLSDQHLQMGALPSTTNACIHPES